MPFWGRKVTFFPTGNTQIGIVDRSRFPIIKSMAIVISYALPAALVIALSLGSSGCASETAPADDTDSTYAGQRDRMVERQLEAREIADSAVLRAMRQVPRHHFVPERYRESSYSDNPLPIGAGQTISQPYIVAKMTELADVSSDDRVLEIGTGSGYQAAVLAELTDTVFTIEIIESLGKRADSTLHELGYKNVFVRIGDGYAGWPEKAPFDVILLTAAPPEIPQPLLDQLADGGRMVAPVGTDWQELLLIERNGEQITRRTIIPVRFVPMTGKAQERPDSTD